MATLSEDNSILKRLDDITECSICKERFTNPRSLSCFHSFCLTCFEGLARNKKPGSKMRCPVCRKKFIIPNGGVSELPSNFIISNLLQIKLPVSRNAAIPCGSCQSDDAAKKNAVMYCRDCKSAICVVCYMTLHKPHDCLDINDFAAVTTEISHLADVAERLREILASVERQKLNFSKMVGDAEMKICEAAAERAQQFERRKPTLDDQIETNRPVATDLDNADAEASRDANFLEHDTKLLLGELDAKQRLVVERFDHLWREITHHLALVHDLKKSVDELSIRGAAADIARETIIIHGKVQEMLKVTVFEQLRDRMGSTGITFTALNVLAEDGSMVFGKIDVTIPEKVTEAAMPAPVPTLIHVIPEGSTVVTGVTSLHNRLFVVRQYAKGKIEVYDTETFRLQRNIPVHGLDSSMGLASCAVNNCLYTSFGYHCVVFRVALLPTGDTDTVTEWRVGSDPWGVSVNSANNVLVTCRKAKKIQEYTTHGSLIRDINISSVAVSRPFCSIQLSSGHIAISYDNQVCVVDNRGVLINSNTSVTGASIQVNGPRGFASAQNGYTLLADYRTNRVFLFNRSFTSRRVLPLPSNCSLNGPYSLFLDRSRGRLYIGENDGRRVLVFDNLLHI